MRPVRYAVYDRRTGIPRWVVTHSPRPVWMWRDAVPDDVRAWAIGRPEFGAWRDPVLADITIVTPEDPEADVLELPPGVEAYDIQHGYLVYERRWARKVRWIPYDPRTGEILGPAVDESEPEFLARHDGVARLALDPVRERERRLDGLSVDPHTQQLRRVGQLAAKEGGPTR